MIKQIIMNSDDIDRSLDRISLEIIEKNHGIDDLAVVGIHTGGVFLAERIQKKIIEHENSELILGHLDITLYRDDWSLISQNPVVRKTDIGFGVDNRRVILVDDVIFTGRTIRAAMDAIMDYGRPLSIQLAALVDRGGRELPIQPDFVGLTVGVDEGEKIDVILTEKDGRDEVVLYGAGE
jgi:pyrimidine operon attenuation protein/uracil phosphoribosyltransferase